MNHNVPTPCLLRSFSQVLRNSAPRRHFHASPIRAKRTKRTSVEKQQIRQRLREVKPYTKKEIEALKQKYTPAQLAAIEAGEDAVRPEHLAAQAAQRTDPWSLRYLDDLSKIDAVVDNPIRAPYENSDPRQRLKTTAELDDEIGRLQGLPSKDDEQKLKDLQRLLLKDPKDLSDADFEKIEKIAKSPQKSISPLSGTQEEQLNALLRRDRKSLSDKERILMKYLTRKKTEGALGLRDLRITEGKEEAELEPRSALAPEIFARGEKNLEGVSTKKKKDSKTSGGRQEEEPSPALLRLMQMTGYDQRQISLLRVKTLVNHTVTNQTRMGKVGKFYQLAIAGNGNGLIGIGEGKSEEVLEAGIQAQYRAIRNMRPILRYENRTIFGDVKGKVGAVELELYNRPPGFGLRCSQYVWEIARCAGLHDLAARVGRSRNPMNTVKATIEALMKQKNPEDVARARGKKMVDVRKVYYSGLVI
ncbi:MAG: hypothetical protein Q9227_005250 [Pyrenula ochraceoflavens]